MNAVVADLNVFSTAQDAEASPVRTSNVQPATLSEVMRYSRTAFDKSNYAPLGFNAVMWRTVLRTAILDKSMLVRAAWRGSQCVGLLVGQLGPLPWCVGLSATDLVFVADQGGDLLLRDFVAWAESHKVRRIDMGVSDSVDAELRNVRTVHDRFFRAAGFERAGGMYFKQGAD